MAVDSCRVIKYTIFMKYLRIFWQTWKNSFSSAEYYKDVLKAPFGFSLKYFLFFCFLLSLVLTMYTGLKIVSPVNQFVSRFPSILSKVYPEELEIRISKGVVTTNVPQPYFIPIDRFEEGFEELEKQVKGLKSDDFKNILVIDTDAKVEDMKRYQTYMLLSRSHLSYFKDDGRIETVSLEKINNFTLNRSFISNNLNKFAPWIRVLAIFLVPFIFVGSFIFFVSSQLVYLLIVALILFLGAKVLKSSLNYWKAYQIDLHLATIITPFFLLLSALNMNIQFPFLRLLVYSVIGLYIVNSFKKTPAVPVKKKPKKSSRRR